MEGGQPPQGGGEPAAVPEQLNGADVGGLSAPGVASPVEVFPQSQVQGGENQTAALQQAATEAVGSPHRPPRSSAEDPSDAGRDAKANAQGTGVLADALRTRVLRGDAQLPVKLPSTDTDTQATHPTFLSCLRGQTPGQEAVNPLRRAAAPQSVDRSSAEPKRAMHRAETAGFSRRVKSDSVSGPLAPAAERSQEKAQMQGGRTASETAPGLCSGELARDVPASAVGLGGSGGAAETLEKHAGARNLLDTQGASGCLLDLPRSTVAARNSDGSRTPETCLSPVDTPETPSSLPTVASLGNSPVSHAGGDAFQGETSFLPMPAPAFDRPLATSTARAPPASADSSSSPSSAGTPAASASPSPLPWRQSVSPSWSLRPRRAVPNVVPDVELFSTVRRLQRRSLMKLTGSDEGAYGENCCASLLELFRLLQERYGLSPASVFLDIGSGSGVPSFLASAAVGCVASLGVEIDSNVYAIACNNHLQLLDQRLVASLATQDLLLRTREARPHSEQPEALSSGRNGGTHGGDCGSFLAPLDGVVGPALLNCLRDRTAVTEEDLTFSVANVSAGLDREAEKEGENEKEGEAEQTHAERGGGEEAREPRASSQTVPGQGARADPADCPNSGVSDSLFALSPTGLAYPCNVAFKCADASLFASFDGVSHIFSFDLAMPPRVLFRLCSLFNRSQSPVVYVSFHSTLASTYGLDARLVQRLRMRMAGSAESHVAFIYVRSCLSLAQLALAGGERAARPRLSSAENKSRPRLSKTAPFGHVYEKGLQRSGPQLLSDGAVLRSGRDAAATPQEEGWDCAFTAGGTRETWREIEHASLVRALLLRGVVHSRTESFFSRCVLAGVLPRVAFTLLHAVGLLCTDTPLSFEAQEGEVRVEQPEGGRRKENDKAETGETENVRFSPLSDSVLPALQCCRKCCSEIFLSNLAGGDGEFGGSPRHAQGATVPSIRGLALPVPRLPQQQLLLLRRLVGVFGLDQLLETGALSPESLEDLFLLRPVSACLCGDRPCASGRHSGACAAEAAEAAAATEERGNGEAKRSSVSSLRSPSSFVCVHGVRRLALFLGKVILQRRLARPDCDRDAQLAPAGGSEPVAGDAVGWTSALLEVRVCRKWDIQRKAGVSTDPISLDAWNAEAPSFSGNRRSARLRREGASRAPGVATQKTVRKVSQARSRKPPGTTKAQGRGPHKFNVNRARPRPRREGRAAGNGSQRGRRGAPVGVHKAARTLRGNGGVRRAQASHDERKPLRGEESPDGFEEREASLDDKWMRFFVCCGADLSVPDAPDGGQPVDSEKRGYMLGPSGIGDVGVLEIPCLSPLCYTCGARTVLPQLLEANAPPAVQQLKIQSEILQLQTNPLIQLADKEGQAAWDANLSREAGAFFRLGSEDESEGNGDERHGRGATCKGRACSKGQRAAAADRLKRRDESHPNRSAGHLREATFPSLSDTSGADQVELAERRPRCVHAIRATLLERLNEVLSPRDTSAAGAPLLCGEAKEDLADGLPVKSESISEGEVTHHQLEVELCRRVEWRRRLCDPFSSDPVPDEIRCSPVAFLGAPAPADSLQFVWDFARSADPSVPPRFLSRGDGRPRGFRAGDVVPLLWPEVRATDTHAERGKQEIVCWNAQLLRVQRKTSVGVAKDPICSAASPQRTRREARRGEERVKSAAPGDSSVWCEREATAQSRETRRTGRKGAQSMEAEFGVAENGWEMEEELDWEIAPGLPLWECRWEVRAFPVAGDAETCYQEAREWIVAQLTAQETAALHLLRRLNAPLLRLSRQAAVACLHLDPCVAPEEVAELRKTVHEADQLQRLWVHARFLEFALLQELMVVDWREAKNGVWDARLRGLLQGQILRLQQLQTLRELGERDISPARAQVLLRQLKDAREPRGLLHLPASAATGVFPIQEAQEEAQDARSPSSGGEGGTNATRAQAEEAGEVSQALGHAPAAAVREAVLSLLASLFRGRRPTQLVEEILRRAVRLLDLLCIRTQGPSREAVAAAWARRANESELCAWLPEAVRDVPPGSESRRPRGAEERQAWATSRLAVLRNFLRRQLGEFRRQLLREVEEEQHAMLLWLLARESATEASQVTARGRRETDETSGVSPGGEPSDGSSENRLTSQRGSSSVTGDRSTNGSETKPASSTERPGKEIGGGGCSSSESSSTEAGGDGKAARANARSFSSEKNVFALTFVTAGAKGVPEAFACLHSLPEHLEALMKGPLPRSLPIRGQDGNGEGAQTVEMCPLWRSYFLQLGLIHTAKELLFRRSLLDAGDSPAAPARQPRASPTEDKQAVVPGEACIDCMREGVTHLAAGTLPLPGKEKTATEVSRTPEIAADREEANRCKAFGPTHKGQRDRDEDGLLASPRAPKKRRSAESRVN
ncbi:conserved hypothetical protein [Neospora caninum Liverpool]|uniref:DOT1 domain-containing protein n=1 Tax=Neospora caninum (strain Liverpool) TaxID=572307 RepID=F0VCH0_NEOCL|nr:conserved hypothetical protein [Neospora caninum Liverpool]CBZ51292.1 conserved hypothetical protein [Neospora caninum Liverpool]CEL68606.1 TPA: hypothetical protein BN1204_043590 [Neospora caninum Liverpool]|eukprot:XP_003881325.1 conserved hypothetical protein [Neospora caninum Liverpool]